MMQGKFEKTRRRRKGVWRLRSVALCPRPQDQVESIGIGWAFARAASSFDVGQAHCKRRTQADDDPFLSTREIADRLVEPVRP